MQGMGWGALTLAITGVAGSVGTFLYCNARHGDDPGWGYGTGTIVFLACLLVLLIFETVALWLGWRAKGTLPGLLAMYVSVPALIGAGILIAGAF